jgi:hypothetical protein
MSTNVEAVARSALKSRTVWPRVTRGMTATIMVAMAPAVSAYGRLHRHADVEDRESEQQEPDDQPSVADMQDEQQLFVPSCEARPAAETRGMDQGGNDERRAGQAVIGKRRPQKERRREHGHGGDIETGGRDRQVRALAD